MQGQKFLLALVALMLSSGVVAAPHILSNQLVKREPSSTLSIYDALSFLRVKRAASEDVPNASKGEASKGEDSKGEASKGEDSKGEASKGEDSKGEASAASTNSTTAPDAAGNPFTQVIGDITSLDPLAAVSDLAAPITGALKV